MDFGRLAGLDGVDFTLPPDPIETSRALARLGREGEPRIRLGMPSWSDRRLLGKIYPPGTRREDFLARYAESFAAIELNTTWYGVNREWIRSWAAAVPGDFRFSPKFPREIAWDRRLQDAEGPTARFLEAIRDFGATLGRAWILLPGDFGPAELPVLAAFLRRWSPECPLAVEFRDPAWFQPGSAGGEAFELLEETGTVAVLTDVAGRRDVLHQRVTAGEVFLRFVGNGLHPTDAARLGEWAARLANWARTGLREANLFLHQPEEHLAVELAEILTAELAGHGAPPPRPVRRVARQERLF